ncbi:hypothetical protein AUJ66_04535 [Candidatus Desantisbacteria bacterium CG1_02_38_46]|uniref:Uncharacterized protein n=3 Tax=unclassified Candidatus Desantisiibacteriota TaxID=3106372 RepID=A0A2H9PAU4_9BACT|nr:MAG: hypothetical protein AUJ66_04535 [Candidatus Desantisbacteria bacterium CG1_02_38_46]PIU50762.1 MAG: hypothetical protein COS91_08000 [Candidatus Desantisbacteria bacterium CG07_land_8_20_14_0_80_39_15]PIZ15703.1 MAG: hypothetical protein COY51_04540 [Candidatus Desantisbacteria bacterium CG_4_10_14_0_8_um_filter_39_17]
MGIKRRLKDVDWVWEGQGFDQGVEPSIFGVGEGAIYFGLSRVCYMFHPNTEFAMKKLSNFEEVVCDISKWKFKEVEREGNVACGMKNSVDAKPETVKEEAGNISKLSLKFHNITGAIHDDMLGLCKRENYTPQQYGEIYKALHNDNSELKLWVVVYTHELDPAKWEGFLPYIDVVNLWVWEARNLTNLDEDIQKCRKIFSNKPIILGCYLRDYPTVAPVPMDLLRCQWERIPRYLDEKLIAGYSILGAVLIDGQQEQAEWVRDFIAKHD